MKIVHIIPGSGGSFYCGNCLRDSKYFEKIRKLGVDAVKVPMYLPLSGAVKGEDSPVFFGAVSLYLKQMYPVFRKMPAWTDALLNSKPMLKLASSMANSTRASGLEDMTISMLMGEDGKQKRELEKLTNWLEEHFKPDIIHLSNALLTGLAPKLKNQLNIPVVCSLQDEDVWVNSMHENFKAKVWELMQNNSKYIDKYISVSKYYTGFMKDKLKLSDEKLNTLYLGIDPADYRYINSIKKPNNIGYISRLCEENGLDILIDAFILLKKNSYFADANLYLTGGSTGDDKHFIKKQKDKIREVGLENNVFFIKSFDERERLNFFDNISVLSVPVKNGEAFGIYLTEAMASGIPIVQPALGAFPEIVEKSKGGMIYNNNTAEQLSQALSELLLDQNKLEQLSKNARHSTEDIFNINILAQRMIEIYKNTCSESM